MQTDLNDWSTRFQQVASLTDRKYVLIVNPDDFWPMAARLFHNQQVRVQASAFVQKGAAYVVPDPEEN
jgi:hypothetical protein